ncbi:MAG: hypothetical protein MHM6MM_004568 [Cercozoa sp. M6MM]
MRRGKSKSEVTSTEPQVFNIGVYGLEKSGKSLLIDRVITSQARLTHGMPKQREIKLPWRKCREVEITAALQTFRLRFHDMKTDLAAKRRWSHSFADMHVFVVVADGSVKDEERWLEAANMLHFVVRHPYNRDKTFGIAVTHGNDAACASRDELHNLLAVESIKIAPIDLVFEKIDLEDTRSAPDVAWRFFSPLIMECAKRWATVEKRVEIDRELRRTGREFSFSVRNPLVPPEEECELLEVAREMQREARARVSLRMSVGVSESMSGTEIDVDDDLMDDADRLTEEEIAMLRSRAHLRRQFSRAMAERAAEGTSSLEMSAASGASKIEKIIGHRGEKIEYVRKYHKALRQVGAAPMDIEAVDLGPLDRRHFKYRVLIVPQMDKTSEKAKVVDEKELERQRTLLREKLKKRQAAAHFDIHQSKQEKIMGATNVKLEYFNRYAKSLRMLGEDADTVGSDELGPLSRAIFVAEEKKRLEMQQQHQEKMKQQAERKEVSASLRGSMVMSMQDPERIRLLGLTSEELATAKGATKKERVMGAHEEKMDYLTRYRKVLKILGVDPDSISVTELGSLSRMSFAWMPSRSGLGERIIDDVQELQKEGFKTKEEKMLGYSTDEVAFFGRFFKLMRVLGEMPDMIPIPMSVIERFAEKEKERTSILAANREVLATESEMVDDTDMLMKRSSVVSMSAEPSAVQLHAAEAGDASHQ